MFDINHLDFNEMCSYQQFLYLTFKSFKNSNKIRRNSTFDLQFVPFKFTDKQLSDFYRHSVLQICFRFLHIFKGEF